MSSKTVEHPACQCCPHTEMSDLERDRLAREVWDGCPDTGCLWSLCTDCSDDGREAIAPGDYHYYETPR